MNNKTTLVILVRDELEAIKQLIPKISLNSVDDVIIMDGQSKDGTREFLQEKGFKVFTQKKLGRGNAFLESLEYTSNENLIFFSGDGNENSEDIPKMNQYLKEGYDLVIGGRFILGGSKSDDSDDPLKIRRYGNIAFSKIVDTIWGSNVKDSINGFRGMKRTAMERMKLDAPKHEIELQSTIRAAKLKLKIKEFPTAEQERLGGIRKNTAGTSILAYRLSLFLIKEILIGKKFADEKS
ncbi:glycosyltransferase [Candidatus Woesearchaeota archaeon]|nr:glycosyltransferase [Candidatus Woesearchaeota archaeon]